MHAERFGDLEEEHTLTQSEVLAARYPELLAGEAAVAEDAGAIGSEAAQAELPACSVCGTPLTEQRARQHSSTCDRRECQLEARRRRERARKGLSANGSARRHAGRASKPATAVLAAPRASNGRAAMVKAASLAAAGDGRREPAGGPAGPIEDRDGPRSPAPALNVAPAAYAPADGLPALLGQVAALVQAHPAARLSVRLDGLAVTVRAANGRSP